jgi:molybdate transport repressor ModE-like protein
MAKNKSKFSYKIWLEYEGKPLIGKGGAQILEEIEKEKSISKAAEKLGMSYRYVWSYLQRIRKALGEPVVETYRGGKSGGGGAKLTKQGKKLLEEYKRVEDYFDKVLTDKC